MPPQPLVIYFDTSALVKLFVNEPQCVVVREWHAMAQAVATSVVTRPEAAAALARRQREGAITTEGLAAALDGLATWWHSCLRIQVDADLAAELALSHELRGMDAVQLAAAMSLRSTLAPAGLAAVAIATFDQRLQRAAAAEGLSVAST
jgi:predicted nucleic acid-binding protein